VTRRENIGRIAELADIFLYRDAVRNPCVWPATMYREAGPVIETPIFMAAALQECCLQSRRDGVYVFPAVPAQWPDAAFADWHAEGDFLISARRTGGRTRWIHVVARSSSRLRLYTDLDLGKVYWNGRRQRPANAIFLPTGHGLEIDMPAGDSLLLSDRPRPDLHVRPAGRRFGVKNPFGLNARFLKPRPHFSDPDACRKPVKSHWLGGKPGKRRS
ncbi:MAG: hypothetical protein LC725_10350, partial [Lentisphaerae bacterium]|nr:hypothetical protein [Lentisphaerota bacterium]